MGPAGGSRRADPSPNPLLQGEGAYGVRSPLPLREGVGGGGTRTGATLNAQELTLRQTFRIYYEDTDAGAVVYHARYLAFAERARTEALRALGVPHAEMAMQHGLIFMVRRVEIDYQAPARLDDELGIVTRVLHVGAASVTLLQSFDVVGRPIGALRVGLACVRLADGRPQRLPARWRDALEAELSSESSG